ncbi:NB-ARC domain-containing protein [Alkalinema pantanalense CENA528]|uniref:NB-ARC domain-containing protein n=1 Tax=Alkalinema pantanalense TaxID=1620705 RepID=UPI003D6DF92F
MTANQPNSPSDRKVLIKQSVLEGVTVEGDLRIGDITQIVNYADRLLSCHQLPNRNLNFVGRVAEQAEIRSLLEQSKNGGGVAISAIAGMGGIGKSALALHLAHELMPDYPDAQLYVNLRGAEAETALGLSAEAVLGGWLVGLGYEAQQVDRWSLEEKANAYRSWMRGKRAIVLLDNARDAAQVKPLLPGSAGCVVLVTSRRSLATVAGLQEHRLGVLQPQEAIELFQKTAGLAEGDRAQLEAVVELCGRLPLGIEIVAATMKVRRWDLVRVVEKLQKARLNLMRREDLDVRACFELSYCELEAQLARVFLRVSGIPGADFGTPIAEVALEQEDLLEALEELEEARLLESRRAGRFEMHDLLREFAQEKLEPEEAHQVGLRAVQWYAGVADFCDDCVRGAVKADRLAGMLAAGESEREGQNRLSQEAIAWFQSEFKNLLQAVIWADGAEEWSLVIRLPRLLDMFTKFQTGRGELLAVYGLALEAARRTQDRLGEANTLQAIADVLQFKDRRDEALENYREAIGIYREVGARLGEANVCDALALLSIEQKNYPAALNYHQQALVIFQSMDSAYNEGWSYLYIARTQIKLNKAYEAQQSYQSAIACFQQIGMDNLIQLCHQEMQPINQPSSGPIAPPIIDPPSPQASPTTRPRPKSSNNPPNFWILFGIGLAIALLIYWLKR